MKYLFRFLKPRLALPIGLAVAAPWTLPAAVLTFQNGGAGYVDTRDTDLRSASAAIPQGTNSTVRVSSNQGGGPVHGLLKFEHIVGNATNQIPLRAKVESATLILHTASGATLTNTISLHRLLAPWDQNSSTWNSLSDGISTDNTEALASPDATFIPRAINSLSTTAMLATVQMWVSGLSTNQGWAFLSSGFDFSFHSSEASLVTNRPSLLISFTPSSLSITDQPRSQSVCAGGSANFCVTASGTPPLIYQWRHDGLTVSGATTNNCLNLTNVQPNQAGTYTVVVTNAGGSVVSSNAVLTVDAGRPVIVCPPNLVVFAIPNECCANVPFTVMATNNCGNTNFTITCNPTNGSAFRIGTNLVSCTATDTVGNSNTCSFIITVFPSNALPTMVLAVTNRTINANSSTGPIPFTVRDVETEASNLAPSASSSNTNLVPLRNIIFGGSGSNRTVTVTPAANQFGFALVTLIVEDGNGGRGSNTFRLTVRTQ